MAASDPLAPPFGIPKRLRIGHLDIAVRSLPEALAEKEGVHGVYREFLQWIGIREDVPSTERAGEVLLHEVLHALFAERGVKTALVQMGIPEKRIDAIDELVAEYLGAGLAALFADNRGIGALLDDLLGRPE